MQNTSTLPQLSLWFPPTYDLLEEDPDRHLESANVTYDRASKEVTSRLHYWWITNEFCWPDSRIYTNFQLIFAWNLTNRLIYDYTYKWTSFKRFPFNDYLKNWVVIAKTFLWKGNLPGLDMKHPMIPTHIRSGRETWEWLFTAQEDMKPETASNILWGKGSLGVT